MKNNPEHLQARKSASQGGAALQADPRSSLRWDSDLLAAKPCADVIVHAAAHAPRGAKAKAVPVTLRVASIDKSIVVHGERTYRRSMLGSIGLTEAQPFVVSRIRYEHAYGGIDAQDSDPRLHRIDMRNPIGVGFAVQPMRLLNQPAPVIEYPRGDHMSDDIHIVALSARTAVGLNAGSTAAAIRAGVSRVREHGFLIVIHYADPHER